MDHSRIHVCKTRAIKKHKSQHWLNDFILYSLTTLACTSFCSSPLWYPPFCATFNVFFFFSLPKITSFFFTSKVLFIVCNLIVIFLLGESKFFAYMSKAYNDVYHDKYECNRLDQIQVISQSQEQNETYEEFFEVCDDEETCESHVDQIVESCGDDEEELSCSEQEVEEEKHEGSGGDGDVSLPAEELNKLVEDFIAKINRKRWLEAEFGRG
ncbi:hypothetical protein L1987_69682 [Smallanthus sonchifolius]|uniref:Uncharacterized protein n=1 Tax=Smallanthus sonchifolius TaxID=185202 RepID=A0ACB9B7S0_9ASTR|nr:hypothetical protein L1987_69682 [Smallanthus sonchifolius]